MLVHKRIKELRNEFALSQLQLANNLSLSQSAIAKWEIEKTEPSASAIIKMCKFFDVSADYLLGLKDEY